MLDLGRSFLASVARTPDATGIIDGETSLTYADWAGQIGGVACGLREMGLRPGDHLLTAMQNTLEAATLHWACQFADVTITPVNFRAKPDELDFFIENAEARAIVYDAASREAVEGSARALALPRIAACDPLASDAMFEQIAAAHVDPVPLASADSWSLMLYTSGTTARPKGVPRRHHAERAAAIAHVAQNLYRSGESTLGVMPLYHTMGVRSLLAMSLVGGCFACLPRFSVEGALALIEDEGITSLYLVPTLYHDILDHPDFVPERVRGVRRLGYAGAPMTEGLTRTLVKAFEPDLFVNHYGSSEIYTFTVDQNAAAKPGSAGKAGLNQMIRVIRLDGAEPDDLAPQGEEGQIIALLAGDEAFEGYWRRPEADEKSLRDGWYFTGDSGYFDADGDLFVTGRVDDMIITGGENVSPVEVESCLSLHPAVSEVAVVGLPDERWGKIVTAFVRRDEEIEADTLDAHCRASGLANFKRPRRYVFVQDIPKSPVGKLLRRKLIAGEYVPENPDNQTEEIAS